MAEPPSELGAEKLIVAKASPAETVTFRGVPGKVKVETGLLGPLLPPPHAVKKTTAAQKIQGNLFMFIKLLEFYSALSRQLDFISDKGCTSSPRNGMSDTPDRPRKMADFQPDQGKRDQRHHCGQKLATCDPNFRPQPDFDQR